MIRMSEGYEALHHKAAWLDLSARGRLIMRGRDRARLLHNVTSNEIKKLAPGSGCYAFVLTPQGRIQADLHVFAFPDHYLLETEPELREKAAQLVMKYKVADQVELEDVTGSTTEVGVEGPEAEQVLMSLGAPVPAEPYAHVAWEAFTVVRASITGQPGFRIFGPAGQQPDFAAAGVKPAGPDDIRIVRIENGRPHYGEDIRETSLPQETREMQAVSFTKGCYIGQEIVERIRAQGHVNKFLVRLVVDAPEPPAPGTKLLADGQEAGEITSAVLSPQLGKVAALGYVRAAHAEPSTVLHAGEWEAQVL